MESHPRKIVTELWETLKADTFESPAWTKCVDEILALLPEEDTQRWLQFSLADDALASLVYAIRFILTPDTQEVAWAGRRAYEAADQAALRRLDIRPATTEGELAVLSHPIVQRELARQRRDLDILRQGPESEAIEKLRALAFSETLLTDAEQSENENLS